MAAIIAVFEFPPKLSLSSQVSTESLYGMKSFFFLEEVFFVWKKLAKMELTVNGQYPNSSFVMKTKAVYLLYAS